MAVQFQIGQILQGQERFDEAIATFQEYLSKSRTVPNRPPPGAPFLTFAC